MTAAPASAHAQLVSSDPADGSTVQSAPAKATLRLSEAVVPGSVKATLTDGNGRTMQMGAVKVVIGAGGQTPNLIPSRGQTAVPTAVLLDLPALPPDVYHLAWQTLSADDLHVTSGVIVFGVQRDAGGARGQVDDPWPGLVEVALRWAQLLAASLAVGAGALSLLGPAGAYSRRRLHLLGAAAAGVAVVVQGLLLLAQAAATDASPTALLSGGYGIRWYTRLLLTLGLGAWHVVALRRSSAAGRSVVPALTAVGVVLTVGQAMTTAMLGHAGTTGPLQLVLTTGHGTAVMVWVGALLAALALLTHSAARGYLKATMPRLGVVAAGCLAVVVVTGTALAGRSVASIDALLLSTYGRELLAKLTLVAVALVLAARTRHWVRRLRNGPAGSATDGWARPLVVEAAVLAAVLVGAAGLASSRPAIGTQWAPASEVKPLVTSQVNDLVETATVSPNRPGRNFVTVDVFETRRPSPGPIQQVLLTVRRADATDQLPGQQIVLQPQGDSRWLAATDVLAEAGDWDLQVVVRRGGLPDETASYSWVVADPSARLAAPVVSSAPLGGVLDLLALALAGAMALLAGWSVVRRRREAGGARPLQRDDSAPGSALGTHDEADRPDRPEDLTTENVTRGPSL